MRTEVRAPFGSGCAGLRKSRRTPCRSGRLHRAFSLLELIGVLAVIAILVAVLAPSFVRQMDKTAGDQESATLKSFGDALLQSIMRNRYIPSATDWASTVAIELGVDLASVTNSPRRQPRFFLIDPALQVGVNGGGLPYTQNNTGSVVTNNSGVIPPVARFLILSSIGTPLTGVTTGVGTAADFTNIWNSPDGTVPPAPVFAGWTGAGNDLKVQRVDLSPLFVHLFLSTHFSSGDSPRYSIDSTNWNTATVVSNDPNAVGTDSYFIQNSVLVLHTGQGTLDSQQILIRDNSFIYDQNTWRGSIGGEGFAGGLDIASVVNRYLAAYPNAQAQNGANQQAVVVQSMINYMDRYDDWAAAGFPTASGDPSYIAVNNAQLALKNAVQGQYLANSYVPNEVPCQ